MRIKTSTNIALAIGSLIFMWIFGFAFGDIKKDDWWEFIVMGALFVSFIKFTIDSFIQEG